MINVRFRTNEFFKNLVSFERKVDIKTEDGLKRVAQYIMDDIKGNWSPVSPSSPYNPPAIDTGAYNKSIRIEPLRGQVGRFAKGWVIVFNTDLAKRPRQYARALELGTGIMKPRPHIKPALNRAQKKFEGVKIIRVW